MRRLFYRRPAEKWEEALPLGNGRLGAMVFGGVGTERLQLNEDSVWYGGPRNRINPDARGNLQTVRDLLHGGHISEAEELLKEAFSGVPESQRPYQPLGDLILEMKELTTEQDNWGQPLLGAPEKYERELCLNEAVARTGFTMEGVEYRREYFCSAADQVLVLRLTADRPGRISFDTLLRRERFFDSCACVDSGMTIMEGSTGEGGIGFCVALKVETEGGTLRNIGERVVVRQADSAVIYLAGETGFYRKDWKDAAVKRLREAAGRGYERLLERHLEDYKSLFDRVELKLAHDTALDQVPTDERLKRFADSGHDNGLVELYFDFGRYLLISSSRPGSQPANLQGIWNDQMKPSWDSKYTININTEMNYWMAEPCNLPECHLPLFDLIHRVAATGAETAREMYGCRGFVAHHNTDLWGDSAPQDIYIPATYWVLGGAWLCTHIMRHYEYTQDKDWLREEYPYLKEAVLFFHDFLIEEEGEVILSPSVSPENTYLLPDGTRGRVCEGCTMDSEILRDLFTHFLAASRLLGIADEVTGKTRELLDMLPVLKIGKHGQIMEWREDYDEVEPGHRHVSQLYALYPSGQIRRDKTPELAEAAARTLERRLYYGGGHTGWSCAWIICFYARLWNGEEAWQNLKKLLTCSTFETLLCNHPRGEGHVFQIDGNLGAVAAILEMLIQADGGEIRLLPALPKEWPEGSLRGVKLPGGRTADLAWKDGKIVHQNIS